MTGLRWSLHRARPAAPSGAAGRALSPAQPPVLLVHGLAVTAAQCWVRTGWTRALAHRDLVLIQLPGHGDPAPAAGASASGEIPVEEDDGVPGLLAAILEAGAEACESLGVPVLLDGLGYSLGARLLWQLAREEPEALCRLVLGGLPARDLLADLPAAPTGLPSPAPAPGPGAGSEDPAGLGPTGSRVLPGPRDPDPALAELGGVLARSTIPRERIAALLPLVTRPRFAPAPGPGQPLLLAAGTSDAVAGPDLARLAALAPGCTALPLPQRTHADALTSGILRRAGAAHLDAAAASRD
ncbi:alpha/beta fold hydrolase [Rothia kristinae]|uniref:alpha/beta fold hydrolase n=1 Tax=Rothia kristinae TaxID=37923 RepID=UPI0022E10B1C|nr:alpha/beta fold hydrolase [Rothia kristinae]